LVQEGKKMKNLGNYSRSKSQIWLMASLLALLVTGCGGDVSSSAPGTLGASLTDTPACGFDKVYVTVNKVRVHQSSSASDKAAGWTDITLMPARKIDLLSLNNGALDNLGEAPLAAGHYTQLRLVLDPNTSGGLANSVVLSGSTTPIPLITPSAVQSGVKLINEFDVASGQRVDLVLDFNACKSIVKRGSGTYALKPVIRVIPFALNGIRGFVDPALLGSNVMVTAQQNGSVVQSTTPKTSGEFFLTRLVPGIYDVVLTADGQAAAVITGVPVDTATSIVDISDSGTPVKLQASVANNTVSGTVTLNPPSTTEVGYVSAKQTFGTAQVVTVKSVAADDTTGNYSMTLPVDAPWLGQYTAIPPPIILTAQSGVAGQYTLEASANGYQTSTPVGVNISAGNVAHDFILAP
jgi:hypothetical protein